MVIPTLPPIAQTPNAMVQGVKQPLPPTEGTNQTSLALISPTEEDIEEHLRNTEQWLDKDKTDAEMIMDAFLALRDKVRTDDEVAAAIAFFLKFIAVEKPRAIKKFLQVMEHKKLSNDLVVKSMRKILAKTKQYKKQCFFAIEKFIMITKDPTIVYKSTLRIEKSKSSVMSLKSLGKKSLSATALPPISVKKEEQQPISSDKASVSTAKEDALIESSWKASMLFQRTETEQAKDDKAVESNYTLLRILMDAYGGGTDSTLDLSAAQDPLLKSMLTNVFGLGTEGAYQGEDPFDLIQKAREKKKEEAERQERKRQMLQKQLAKLQADDSLSSSEDGDNLSGISEESFEDEDEGATETESEAGSQGEYGHEGGRRRSHHKSSAKPGIPHEYLDNPDDDEETRALKAQLRKQWHAKHGKKRHSHRSRGSNLTLEGSVSPPGRASKSRRKTQPSDEHSKALKKHVALSSDEKRVLGGRINQEAASTAATNYFTKNNINDLFSVMLQGLLLDTPDHPLDYLIDLVRRMRISQENMKKVVKDVAKMNKEIKPMTVSLTNKRHKSH